MNNFTTTGTTPEGQNPIPKHLESLTTSIFQSLFPAISPQRTPLASIRRVLLLNRETNPTSDSVYTLSFRHYAITSKPLVTISRGLKRLRTAEKLATTRTQKPLQSTSKSGGRSSGALPNMSRLDDVADYLLNPAEAGFTSASESEFDTDAEVEVLETSARKVLDKRDMQRRKKAEAAAASGESVDAGNARQRQRRPAPQKRAIKLTELGPRLKLRLVKVEEGVCTGKVMWHEFVQKTRSEEKQLDRVWETRRAEKEERKRLQKENVAKKKAAKGKADPANGEEDDEDEDMDDDEWDEYEGEAREGEEEIEPEEEDEGEEE